MVGKSRLFFFFWHTSRCVGGAYGAHTHTQVVNEEGIQIHNDEGGLRGATLLSSIAVLVPWY